MSLCDPTVEGIVNPGSLWTAHPRFSWKLASDACGSAQTAYELEVRIRNADALVWASGVVASADTIWIEYGGEPLAARTSYEWRVRAMVGACWTDWVGASFTTGLIDPTEWRAPFVEPHQTAITADGLRRRNGSWVPSTHHGPAETRLHPAKYLRQSFMLAAKPRSGLLSATAHGVYSAELNGSPVSDELFAPGYESYDKLLSVQTYDVSGLLTEGENVLGFILADGWYGGRIDFTGTSAQYGDRLSAGWELMLAYDSHTEVVASGRDVVSCDDGPIRYSDVFIGEKFDARRELVGWSSPGFDDSTWTSVAERPAPAVLVPFIGEPVRRLQRIPAERVMVTPCGDQVVDFGQVIAGRVEMRVEGPPGIEVTLEHSEVLDAAGDFLMNIAGQNKDQADVYVLSGRAGGETWEPRFTFHGFRYVRVTGYPGPLRAEAFAAIVIGSDLPITGEFECSDPAINQLHRNVVWSQRGNFLAIPTDCPQRERVGWTGDLQIFAPAATRNMLCLNFLRRWLRNVRADQEPDGTVPVIVPAPPFMRSLANELVDDPLLSIHAAAGWGDAVVIVPWTLYERYGDRSVLSENYDAMRAWVDRQARVAARGVPDRLELAALSEVELERQRLLWNSERTFGDWLAPSIKALDPSLDHMLAVARSTGEVIAPMFQARSAELLARAAGALGRRADQALYEERHRNICAAFAAEYLDGKGRLLVETQGTYVLALAFNLVPEPQKAGSVQRLLDLIDDAGGHLDTGFLSVPFLLDVLYDSGHPELARSILWKRTPPSWLYAVDRGATTIWEDWTAVAPDGTVGRVSFNHYAFGCVDDWLFRVLGGLSALEPGYRAILIAPDFDAPLTWVRSTQATPYGMVGSRWHRGNNDVILMVDVPEGTSARVRLPRGYFAAAHGGACEFALGPGAHRIAVEQTRTSASGVSPSAIAG